MNSMLIDAGALFSVILYTLGSILLIVLIILVIRAIKAMGKVNNLLDDIQYKSNRVDGVFDMIDSTTSFIGGFTDKISGTISGIISKIFDRKGDKKDE